MKNISLLFVFVLSLGLKTADASTHQNNSFRPPSTIIFTEGGIEFAVYPNGQFDFYDPRSQSSHIAVNGANVSLSFNGGYNYGPYVQYDDYGAVVQVESVPIYYNYYGKVARIGRINLDYNNAGQLYRVGALYIHYDSRGQFAALQGYINSRNRGYLPRYHHYQRPVYSVVYTRPYRKFYHPRRFAYDRFRRNYRKHEVRKHHFYRPSDKNINYSHGTRSGSNSNSRSSNTGRSNQGNLHRETHVERRSGNSRSRPENSKTKNTAHERRSSSQPEVIYDTSEKHVQEVKKLPTRKSHAPRRRVPKNTSTKKPKNNTSQHRSSHQRQTPKRKVHRTHTVKKSTNRKPRRKNLRKSPHNSSSSSSRTSGNASRRR